MNTKRVLVTGGSGFIASYCVPQLLQQGYRVRTTLRSRAREGEVRERLTTAGVPSDGELEFVAADLNADQGWSEAVTDCEFVLHVASPFPLGVPKDDNELVAPARDGALRLLRAARDNGVRRVVLTSSFAAVGYSHPPTERPFTEEDWTDPEDSHIGAYVKSKTVAERAAWEFMATEGGEMELAVVNPVGVLGPVLDRDYSTSIEIVRRLMDGDMPGLPRLSFAVVDVRDVADLHLRAMLNPAAKGERFLAVSGDAVGLKEMAQLLRNRLGEAARRVPTRGIPDWVVRASSLFDTALKQVVGELGVVKYASNEKARRLLDWQPRTPDEAIIATAESLRDLGLLRRAGAATATSRS